MSKKSILLLGFILVKFAFHYFAISPDYDLQRDEYLHLDQAHHLAWGYQSIPPFTSWIAYIIYLLGNSVFWIKFFPALFGVLTLVIVWKAIEELDGNLYALTLGATCILFSAILRLNILFQPNSLDVLSWTTLYFFLIKYIKTQNNKWLYFGAIAFAIGFLNKYNIVFAVIGLFPALLLSSHRKMFLQKHIYQAILLAVILISPNLIWQYQQDFPVFHHLKELTETQLVFVNRVDFLKEQLLYYFNSFFVLLAGFYALLFYQPMKKYFLFLPALVFTIIVFVYLKAKGYYAMGLYPIYFAFGSVFLADKLQTGWKKILKPVTIAIPLLLFMSVYPVIFPNKNPEQIRENPGLYKKLGLLRWEDGKEHELPQDFADMLGWKELAEKVDSITHGFSNLDQTILLCDNYGQAGAINYYSKNKLIPASSFSADYINWINLDNKIKNAILVKEDDDEDRGRKEELSLFDTVYLATKRINPLAREKEISIYILRGANIDINKRIQDEIDKKKKLSF